MKLQVAFVGEVGRKQVQWPNNGVLRDDWKIPRIIPLDLYFITQRRNLSVIGKREWARLDVPADTGTACFISISQTCEKQMWICSLRRGGKKEERCCYELAGLSGTSLCMSLVISVSNAPRGMAWNLVRISSQVWPLICGIGLPFGYVEMVWKQVDE